MKNRTSQISYTLSTLTATFLVVTAFSSVALSDSSGHGRLEIQCEGPQSLVIPEIQLRVTDVNFKVSRPVNASAEIEIVKNHFYNDDNEWGMKLEERNVKAVWNGNILTIPAQTISLDPYKVRSRFTRRVLASCTKQFRMLKVILNQATDKSAKERHDLQTREIYFVTSREDSPNSFNIPSAPLKMDVVLKPMEVKSVTISKFIQSEKSITGGNCVATHLGVDQNGQTIFLQASEKFGVEADLTEAAKFAGKKAPYDLELYGRSAEPMFNSGKANCGALGTYPLFYVETVVPVYPWN